MRDGARATINEHTYVASCTHGKPCPIVDSRVVYGSCNLDWSMRFDKSYCGIDSCTCLLHTQLIVHVVDESCRFGESCDGAVQLMLLALVFASHRIHVVNHAHAIAHVHTATHTHAIIQLH